MCAPEDNTPLEVGGARLFHGKNGSESSAGDSTAIGVERRIILIILAIR